jgi:hypothetical protein
MQGLLNFKDEIYIRSEERKNPTKNSTDFFIGFK